MIERMSKKEEKGGQISRFAKENIQ